MAFENRLVDDNGEVASLLSCILFQKVARLFSARYIDAAGSTVRPNLCVSSRCREVIPRAVLVDTKAEYIDKHNLSRLILRL